MSEVTTAMIAGGMAEWDQQMESGVRSWPVMLERVFKVMLAASDGSLMIPAEERDPEEEGIYLVFANDIVSGFYDLAEWRKGQWFERGAHSDYPPNVTHWMTPPSLPAA